MEGNENGLDKKLLVKILVKLPIHCVFRFKCVSKHWNSIISESSFAHNYVSHATDASKFNPRILFLVDTPKFHDDSTSPDELPLMVGQNDPPQPSAFLFLRPRILIEYDILAVSKGLFLLLHGRRQYYIYNFVTRKIVDIPTLQHTVKDHYAVGFVTQMDGPLVQRFRIVKVHKNENNLLFTVYCSETGTWIEHEFNPRLRGPLDSNRPIFAFKGHVHWLACWDGILAYDPFNQNKQCRLLRFPDSRKVYFGGQACFSVFKEYIRFVETTFIQAVWNCTVWRLEDYDKEEWCLERRINHNWIPMNITEPVYLVPLLCHPTDPEIVYLYHFDDGDLISFNLRTGEVCAKYNWKGYRNIHIFQPILQVETPIWPSPIPLPHPLDESSV